MRCTWKGNHWRVHLTCLRGSEKRSNYNDNGIRLLSVFDALEKDSERARMINHQYKAKCGFRGPSQKHLKGQSPPAAREHRMLRISPRS